MFAIFKYIDLEDESYVDDGFVTEEVENAIWVVKLVFSRIILMQFKFSVGA